MEHEKIEGGTGSKVKAAHSFAAAPGKFIKLP